MAYADQNRRYDEPLRGEAAPIGARDRRESAPGSPNRDPATGRPLGGRSPHNPMGRPAVRPAHPLPKHRTGTIDYDRYLERSTNKFKIFSAAERRRRKRAVATGAAIVAAIAIIVIWAIMSQSA